MNFLKTLFVPLAAALALGACAGQAGERATAAAGGAPDGDSAVVTSPAAGVVNEISQDDFARLVAEWRDVDELRFVGGRPAVVDFNATWCGPCRQLAPTLRDLATEYAGRVDFYSIDVDENKDLARALGVSSIPLLLFIGPDGKPGGMVGLHGKDDIVKAMSDTFGF